MAETLEPGGFQLDRFEESRKKFVDAWLAEFGPGSNTASDTPDGHIIDWGTAMARAVEDKCGEAYQAGFITTASGVNQASQILGGLFGSFPKSAESSTASVLAFGVVDTALVGGSAISSTRGDRFTFDQSGVIAQDRWLIFQWGPASDFSSQTLVIGPTSYGPTLALEGTGLQVAQNIHDFIPVADSNINTKFKPYEDASGNGVLIIETNGILSGEGFATASDVDTWRGSLQAVTAEQGGAIRAEPLTINRINSSATGWEGVANLSSATVGTEQDTLARYIQRHLDTLGKNGTSTLVGLIGRLRDVDINPGVEYIEIYNNPFNIPDAAGRNPHSFEVVWLGGTGQRVAEIIWENHPLGIESVGNQDYIIVDPRTKNEHLVRATQAQELFAFLQISLTAGEGFPTTEISDLKTQVANDVVAFGQTRGVGQDGYLKDIASSMKLQGVEDCVIGINATTSPTTIPGSFPTSNFTVSDTQILRWDTTRIAVTVIV